jgi:hypothetical protein
VVPTIDDVRELDDLFQAQHGVATTGQLRGLLTRRKLETLAKRGELVKIWPGVYGRDDPDTHLRLRGLDLRAGEDVAICLGTAALAYGFDTEDTRDLHVLNPDRGQLRESDGLFVHRREGAPLQLVDGRVATAPAWTAVEVARGLRRPRALATLDLALRSGVCDRRGLELAATAQAGRRGIVNVRELVQLADERSESPMESEARLVMLDANLPKPVLQYVIVDRSGRTWRVDFAWPDRKVAVEYEGFDFHSSPDDLRRDRQKRAALNELDWTVIGIVADDVRRRPYEMTSGVAFELRRRPAA